jgi:hypothetical protein
MHEAVLSTGSAASVLEECKVELDLRREAEDFRRWVELKVAAVARTPAPEPVGGIVAMYCYVQDGWVGLDFVAGAGFEFDGDLSGAAWGDLLQRPGWQAFAESDGGPLTVVETDGSPAAVAVADMGDEFLSPRLGRMIAGVLSSAWAEGVFAPLPVGPGCVLSVHDFYGSWGWEAQEVAGRLLPR